MKKLLLLAAVLLLCAAGFLIFAGADGILQTPEEETEYPVLLAALENGDTYLNIHPEGDMTAEEYYAIDSFEWESYISYNGSLYHIALGPIGLAPPMP